VRIIGLGTFNCNANRSGVGVSATGKCGALIGAVVLVLMLGACGSSGKVIQQGNVEFRINEAKYFEALGHQDNSRYFEAIQAWSTVLAQEPRFALGHFNLALVYDRLRMVPEAIEHYELALRLAEEYQEVGEVHAIFNMHLGAAYLQVQWLDEAMHALQRANTLDPYNPIVHYNLSGAYMARRNYDQGLLHANIAVDLIAVPDASSTVGLAQTVDRRRLGRYLLRQAECHLARKEWSKARAVIERARDQCDADIPANMWERLRAGEIHEAEGKEGRPSEARPAPTPPAREPAPAEPEPQPEPQPEPEGDE
jgi:tetratricopeptide (TPR) repeat protein